MTQDWDLTTVDRGLPDCRLRSVSIREVDNNDYSSSQAGAAEPGSRWIDHRVYGRKY